MTVADRETVVLAQHILGAIKTHISKLVIPRFVCALSSDRAACEVAHRCARTANSHLGLLEFSNARDFVARFEGSPRMDLLVLVYSSADANPLHYEGLHHLTTDHHGPTYEWHWVVGVNPDLHEQGVEYCAQAGESILSTFSEGNMNGRFLLGEKPWGAPSADEIRYFNAHGDPRRFFRSRVGMPGSLFK